MTDGLGPIRKAATLARVDRQAPFPGGYYRGCMNLRTTAEVWSITGLDSIRWPPRDTSPDRDQDRKVWEFEGVEWRLDGSLADGELHVYGPSGWVYRDRIDFKAKGN